MSISLTELGEFVPTWSFVERSTSDDAGRRKTQADNATRYAVAEISYTSKGVGQHRLDTPVAFPVVFRTVPHFTSGCATIKNPKPATWHDPVGTCGVWGWTVDSNGFYRGAWLWVRVDAYPVDEASTEDPPVMQVQHFMSFSAVALKTVQTKGMTPNLTPRRPGI